MPAHQEETLLPETGYSTKVDNASQCIDLRSDTVTLPSAEMKKAMVEAILGDDVFGEDPTVNQLEKRCAALFGKEAALFVLSGTMGNLLAVLSHCQRGDELIVGRHNHIHKWEQGNYAQLGGISATTLKVNPDGTMDPNDIEDAIRANDQHMPRTALVCIENTHNFAGGKALSTDYLKSVRKLADKHKLKVHMDGARIYNAAIALNVDVSEICSYVDSMMMCFSKGLGAPMGSILVGTRQFIDEARKKRKAVGGGWRQAGILAACANLALDRAVETIERDHRHAKLLAKGINERTPEALKSSIHADEKDITNMVLVTCKDKVTTSQVVAFFQSHSILFMAFDSSRIRIVLNWGVCENDLHKILDIYQTFVDSIKI
ncbi:hypothetical protein WR25_17648 isoform C [Diploscapter pachys]|nr:hypothetical protein WR25_17648 isoform C [Diploscapter pachys]